MKLKISVGIALIIFWTFLVYVVATGIALRKEEQKTSSSGGGKTGDLAGKSVEPGGNISLTLDEVAKHNQSGDCWMIISGNVYNVTNEISAHPGGSSIMLPYCGKDATLAFSSKERLPAKDHSGGAYAILKDYLLGSLNQSVSQSTLKSISSSPVSNRQRTGETKEEAEDD